MPAEADDLLRWVCAVVKRLGEQAVLVTADPTDAINEGVRVWPK